MGPRICVVGPSGSGKTTLARLLSKTFEVPHVELDAFHWIGPGWTAADPVQFRERVAEAIGGDAWVVDGNYSAILGDAVLECVDDIVWLDLPRARILAQLVARSLTRLVTREELWNGIREAPREILRVVHVKDGSVRWREENLFVWSMRSVDRSRTAWTKRFIRLGCRVHRVRKGEDLPRLVETLILLHRSPE